MKKFFAGLALMFAMPTAAVACSTGPVVYPMPANMAMSYMGTNYCGYRYVPEELQMYGTAVPGGVYDAITNPYGCHPYQFPANPGLAGSIDWYLFRNLEMYSDFYNSGYWYDQFYAPIGVRYHVTVIPRVSYLNTTSYFTRTYATQIRQQSASAVYRGKSGTIKGKYNFPTSNSRAANRPATVTRSRTSNSGSFGTDSSHTSTTTRSRAVTNSGTRRH